MSWTSLALLIVFGVLFDVFLIGLLDFTIKDHVEGKAFLIVFIVVCGVAMTWSFVRLARQGVRLDGDDVVMQRFFSRLRVPRSRIVALDFSDLDLILVAGVDDYFPQLVLDDGSRVDVMMMGTNRKAALNDNLVKLSAFLGVPIQDRSEDTAADEGWSMHKPPPRQERRVWLEDDD